MKNILKALLSVAVVAFGIMPAIAFPDVNSDHWAAAEIKLLSEQGVIVGYPDGTFKPDDNVTRAEFAAMAIRALNQHHTKVVQPVNFTDVTVDHWAYEDIQKALYFDLISYEKEGVLFRPDDSVSRAESMAVAVNALTTETISLEKAKSVLAKRYIDAHTVPEWFLIPAGKAEILGMIVVIPSAQKASLEAERPATRAEVAAILFKMMEQAKLNPNAKLAEHQEIKRLYPIIWKEFVALEDDPNIANDKWNIYGKITDVKMDETEDWCYTFENGDMVYENRLISDETYKKN